MHTNVNVNFEAMNIRDEIEDILYATDLKPREIERLTEKLLNLHSVMQSYMLSDMMMHQEEIISNPIRFNGVHIENIKKIFKNNGTEYKPPF
jgi:hypothetical protein